MNKAKIKKAKKIYKKCVIVSKKTRKSYETVTLCGFQRITSLVSFEQTVWMACKPDKELANAVMAIADKN